MKILIFLCLILIYSRSYQCGVVKEVETVANEVNKGYIENVATNKSENKNQTIEIKTNAKIEEDTKQSVTTKVIISELQNAANIQNLNLKNNTPVQVNVDITLVVNYNKPNTNLEEESIKDNNKDAHTTSNQLNTTTTVTDASLINIEQNSIKTADIDVKQTNTNIKFPGPMNAPIITYNNGVVVVETNDTVTDDKVLFPGNNISVTPVCPKGMFLTENGYCLIEAKERPTYGDDDEVPRSAFSGACLQGYARALDGSCQEIIED
ncbi:hypothetical protein RR48_11369 [Papilio machaon]|uniref:Uncharacterized protein n=1 Tax=Papilio machaon TaxID=76193 RepID=A0A194QPG7_PAPMA|nr:hypothetical protein RR48_11369 [Papilio machaon]